METVQRKRLLGDYAIGTFLEQLRKSTKKNHREYYVSGRRLKAGTSEYEVDVPQRSMKVTLQ
jgi:hypothetical protein